MIRQTYERILPVVPAERIIAVTVASQVDAIRGELPELPAENIVVEPVGRNTAPCLGLVAMMIAEKDPQAVMVALPADHVVGDPGVFQGVVLGAAEQAADGHLVTLGIKPNGPETGYGYIERGEQIAASTAYDAYHVVRFTEKPDRKTAEGFVGSGRFYWNSGMFVWTVSVLLEEVRHYLPELYAGLELVRPHLGTTGAEGTLRDVWSRLKSVSIDYGVMERAEDVVVIPADIGWSDVGSWTSVSEVLQTDPAGNVLDGEHAAIDCENTYILSTQRLIAGIGLRDMIIVDAGDAVLVCPKNRAQDVKLLVEKLRAEGRDHYL
jgi:mannose-1-phosphate guanylyltransferase